jgi:hypothetical protein
LIYWPVDPTTNWEKEKFVQSGELNK